MNIGAVVVTSRCDCNMYVSYIMLCYEVEMRYVMLLGFPFLMNSVSKLSLHVRMREYVRVCSHSIMNVCVVMGKSNT